KDRPDDEWRGDYDVRQKASQEVAPPTGHRQHLEQPQTEHRGRQKERRKEDLLKCGSEPTWHPCDRIGREQTSGDADSGSAQCQNNARDKPGDEPTVGERLPEPPKAKTLRRKSEVPRGGDGA